MSHMIVHDRRVQNIGVIRRRGLGQITEADKAALMEMATDELVVLGRMIHAGRIITSQTFGGVISMLAPVILAIDSTIDALKALVIKPDESTVRAKAAAQNTIDLSSKAAVVVSRDGDSFLDAIASVVAARVPGSSIDYWDSTRTLKVIGAPYREGEGSGGNPTAAFSLSLSGEPGLAMAAGYIYENRDVGQKFAERAKAAGLKGVGMGSSLMLWGLVIVALLALVTAIVLLYSASTISKGLERAQIRAAIAKATEKVAINESLIRNKQAQIAALGDGPATPETQAQARALAQDIDKLAAENAGLAKAQSLGQQALDSMDKEDDILKKLGNVFESFLKYVLWGGATIILIGLGIVVWKVI